MRTQRDVSEQIAQWVKSQLCAGDIETREEHWRSLVRSLRQLGREPESVTDGLTELLSVTGGAFGRGSSFPLLHQEYQKLGHADRGKVDQLYRACLEAAKQDFPYVFHIEVVNVPAKVADLRFASRASEPLPDLNENQRSIAKAFGIPQEKYQREVLAKLYGEERYWLFAARFWAFVMEAGKSYSLDSADVIYDVAAGKFYCELKSNGNTRRAAFAAEIISVPIERGDREGILKAKEAVSVWLEEVLGHLSSVQV